MPQKKKDIDKKDDSLCGLKLCDCCLKENEEILKILNELVSVKTDIKEIKENLKKNEDKLETFNQQSEDIRELKKKIEMLTKDSLVQLTETKQVATDWSSLFKDKVDRLVADVGVVQKSVEATKTSFEISTDRLNRKNNIVAYSLPETNSKSKDKEEILKLFKEITDKDLSTEIIDVFRMGRSVESNQKPRPVLIKFSNMSTKNLVLENSFKLKKSEAFKSVILYQDLSREDRELCKSLLVRKKQEIGAKDDISKWVFRVKGQPGEFHVVAFRRTNL